MNRKKSIAVVGGICLVLSMTVMSFSATEYFTTGDFLDFTANQYEYSGRNVIAEVGGTGANQDSLYSAMGIVCTSHDTLQKGYLGAFAGLYDSYGKTLDSSGWTYSSSSANWLEIKANDGFQYRGHVYSSGLVDGCFGDGYVSKSPNRTVNVYQYGTNGTKTIDKSDLTAIPTVKTNENGETYGSALLAESMDAVPDLISAVATNGAEGYIKKTDVHQDRASTPAEAIAMQNLRTTDSIRTIQVYAADGITVIGTFDMRQTAGETTKPSYLSH